eukprot:3520689-Amphidinium_carterae.1
MRGQAIAVRTDLLPDTYTKALQKLFEGEGHSSSNLAESSAFSNEHQPVSYTHLTLPTILLV